MSVIADLENPGEDAKISWTTKFKREQQRIDRARRAGLIVNRIVTNSSEKRSGNVHAFAVELRADAFGTEDEEKRAQTTFVAQLRRLALKQQMLLLEIDDLEAAEGDATARRVDDGGSSSHTRRVMSLRVRLVHLLLDLDHQFSVQFERFRVDSVHNCPYSPYWPAALCEHRWFPVAWRLCRQNCPSATALRQRGSQPRCLTLPPVGDVGDLGEGGEEDGEKQQQHPRGEVPPKETGTPHSWLERIREACRRHKLPADGVVRATDPFLTVLEEPVKQPPRPMPETLQQISTTTSSCLRLDSEGDTSTHSTALYNDQSLLRLDNKAAIKGVASLSDSEDFVLEPLPSACVPPAFPPTPDPAAEQRRSCVSRTVLRLTNDEHRREEPRTQERTERTERTQHKVAQSKKSPPRASLDRRRTVLEQVQGGPPVAKVSPALPARPPAGRSRAIARRPPSSDRPLSSDRPSSEHRPPAWTNAAPLPRPAAAPADLACRHSQQPPPVPLPDRSLGQYFHRWFGCTSAVELRRSGGLVAQVVARQPTGPVLPPTLAGVIASSPRSTTAARTPAARPILQPSGEALLTKIRQRHQQRNRADSKLWPREEGSGGGAHNFTKFESTPKFESSKFESSTKFESRGGAVKKHHQPAETDSIPIGTVPCAAVAVEIPPQAQLRLPQPLRRMVPFSHPFGSKFVTGFRAVAPAVAAAAPRAATPRAADTLWSGLARSLGIGFCTGIAGRNRL